jgi:uncharacterized protein YuzE
MNKTIFYDKENDILSIHKGFSSDEKFKGNIDAGNLVLDVSTRGRIRGIEIMNASNFLKEFFKGFKLEQILENITDAEFNTSIKPESISIGILFKAKNIENEIPAKIVAIPINERLVVC